MTFDDILEQVLGLLKRQGRVSYRAIQVRFDLNDDHLEAVKDELIYAQQVAVDEDNRVLVWSGHTEGTTVSALQPDQAEPQPEAQKEPPTQVEQPSEPHTPDAERRQLTVMFCDVVDSTALSTQLDPETFREVIRSYQAKCDEVVQHFDGHIAQYLGDGLLIYFGFPVAHEDDAQRAVYTGLGIVDAIAALNTRLGAEYGLGLAVRVGVHTGPVVVGAMGSGGRHENLALGETPNIAARLEGLAAPNTVVISPVTERLVRGAFVFEDLEAQVLKGVAEPMQIFRVLRPTEAHRDKAESLPDGGTFLVGRDEEVGLLLRRWEQSKEGLGQVVLISGEAGIGKSSLVATVRAHVAQEESTRIAFRCSPYHTNSTLYPVMTHLEQMLGFDRDDSPDVKLDKLEKALKTTHLPLGESVPLMATLLSVTIENRYPAPTLSPQQQRQQTLDTLVAWLMEEAEKQPVLAVWEDLHWADPSTLEMLGLALEQTPTVSMLHVLTFRPEFSPPWVTRSHMTPLTLNRLERPHVEALITRMANDKPLPVELVEHIVAKTDGVPLRLTLVTDMREVAAVAEIVDQLTCLSEEHGFSLRAANATFGQDWLLLEQGNIETSVVQIEQHRPAKPPSIVIRYNALLAEAYGRAGQPDAGVKLLNETLELVQSSGGLHPHTAEFHRLKGEALLLSKNAPERNAEAESCFHRAITVAQNQSAKSWELRAATSLATLWQSQGKGQDAYDLLASVYGWFTEGFDTADLQEARALLDELGPEMRPLQA